MWDMTTGQEVETLKGHTKAVTSVALTGMGGGSPRPGWMGWC